MKYINQLNVILAAVGATVVIYVYSVTYWELSNTETSNLEINIEPIEPAMQTRPAVVYRGATTTQRPAARMFPTPNLGNTATSRSRPIAAPEASPGRPVWRGAADGPPDSQPASIVGGFTSPGETRTRPQVQRSTVSRPASSSSGRSPSSSPAPASNSIIGQGGSSGLTQSSRPRPVVQPSPGAEAVKRNSSTNPPGPPVRSSMPPRRPPQ